EPVLEDREWDPRDYDVVERGLRISQIKLSNRLYRAPGHQVFFLRALAGLDGYLKAFGTVRNWHRLFRDIVAAVPDDGRSTPSDAGSPCRPSAATVPASSPTSQS